MFEIDKRGQLPSHNCSTQESSIHKMEQIKWGSTKAQSIQAHPGFEPSTALTQSSCNDGSSSLRGATAFTYSISKIFSCNFEAN